MTLEIRGRTGCGSNVSLTECPICGEDLSDQRKPSWHLAKHDPEDFGLSPRGTRP